jgi:NAD(P)-dependent dehydrogenase (short-subunit alcohol dehydrogenase family)
MDLSGRVVLLTGGGQGIGLESARRLAGRGAKLALVDLQSDPPEELDFDALWLEGDVTDRGSLEAATALTVERYGGIDVVVANAGYAPGALSVKALDAASISRAIDVNLTGACHTVAVTLPHVLARRGHILLVSSLYAALTGVLNAPYAAAKAGVDQLGRSLRIELRPHGATAGVAYFGFVETGMAESAFSSSAADSLRQALPGWITETIPVEQAADALVRGIERRSARVVAPTWVRGLLVLQGLLGPVEAVLARHPKVQRAVRLSEAES